MAENDEFREDLLARFTDSYVIPPLRDRIEDLSFILDCLLQSEAINPEAKISEIGKVAIEAIVNRIKSTDFKGNFRELEALIRFACQAAAKDGRDFLCAPDVSARKSARDWDGSI